MYGYTPVSYPVKGVSAYVPYYAEFDPNLKPQNTENFELGADLRLFNNRLRLEYTFAYQNVTDQIFAVPTAGSSGYQYTITNAGKMYHGTNMTMNYFGATKESQPYHEGTMVVEGIDEATGQPNQIEVSKQDYWMSYNDVTESGIYDTSFFKLRDLTLTYSLPKIMGVDVQVFGFARNVLLWAKLPNFDPESSQGNGNMGGYFERFSVPNTSSYGGGLKFTF